MISRPICPVVRGMTVFSPLPCRVLFRASVFHFVSIGGSGTGDASVCRLSSIAFVHALEDLDFLDTPKGYPFQVCRICLFV
jgi:hypothetical protein